MIQELRQLAHEHDPAVRRGAIQALGAAGKPSKAAVALLVRALGDRNARVKLAAVRALNAAGEMARSAASALLQVIRRERAGLTPPPSGAWP
jgi:HEAT repeat protein